MTIGVQRSGAWSVPAALSGWPHRRWIAAGVLAVPLALGYASLPGQLTSAGWAVADVLSGLLAAVVLASYVPGPGSGRVLEFGCSPCAVMAAAAVFGSLLLRSTSPLDAGIAVVATGLLGFGLLQRLTDVRTCSFPADHGPRADAE